MGKLTPGVTLRWQICHESQGRQPRSNSIALVWLLEQKHQCRATNPGHQLNIIFLGTFLFLSLIWLPYLCSQGLISFNYRSLGGESFTSKLRLTTDDEVFPNSSPPPHLWKSPRLRSRNLIERYLKLLT